MRWARLEYDRKWWQDLILGTRMAQYVRIFLYILHMTGCAFVRSICQYSTFLGVAGRHSNYDNTHDCKNYSHMSHCLAIICTLTSVEYSTVLYGTARYGTARYGTVHKIKRTFRLILRIQHYES